jgi:hypothetical protein
MPTIFLLTKGSKFIIPHLLEKRNNVISVKWDLRIPIDPAKWRSALGNEPSALGFRQNENQ